jgi:hypothetical protein
MIRRFFWIMVIVIMQAASFASAAILVQSDDDDILPLMAAVDLWGPAPVFVLSRDMAGLGIDTHPSLASWDQVLLLDGTPEDLAVDLASIQQMTTDGIEPTDTFFFTVPSDGSYEVYVSGFGKFVGENTRIFVSWDGTPEMDILSDQSSARTKNLLCGRMTFKKGNHQIRLSFNASDAAFSKQRVQRFYRLVPGARLEQTRRYLTRSLATAQHIFAARDLVSSWSCDLKKVSSGELWIKTKRAGPEESKEVRVQVGEKEFDPFQGKAVWRDPLDPYVCLLKISVVLSAQENRIAAKGPVEWMVFKPTEPPRTVPSLKVDLKRINPATWRVDVEDIKGPFWIVFLESFHANWRLYAAQDDALSQGGPLVVHEKARVTERAHEFKFLPQDFLFLFKRPLAADHVKVLGYANGWFVTPAPAGATRMRLTLFFWPQALFYLGFWIACITLILSLILLILRRR